MKTTILTTIMLLTFFSCITADRKTKKDVDIISIIEKKQITLIESKYRFFRSNIETNISEIKFELYVRKNPFITIRK